MSDTLLRPAEAAAMLGVTPDTLSRMARLGIVPSIRPVGQRRYRQSDIEALTALVPGVEMVTAAELADAADCGLMTIYKEIDRGCLPAKRYYGKSPWFITAAAGRAWLALWHDDPHHRYHPSAA